MKTSEIRNKTETELKELLNKLRKDVTETKLNLLQGKEKNMKKGINLRRQLAKTLTILKEKQVLQGKEGNK